jgi:hypothetical protein
LKEPQEIGEKQCSCSNTPAIFGSHNGVGYNGPVEYFDVLVNFIYASAGTNSEIKKKEI